VSFEVAFEGETLVSVYGSRFVKQRGACTRTFASHMAV